MRRLDKYSLCRPCVKNRVRKMILDKDSTRDAKLITEWLKEPIGE